MNMASRSTLRRAMFSAFTAIALLGCCGRPAPRPASPLAALESRLTRPAADTSLVRDYVTRCTESNELLRAQEFFAVMILRHPDEPLYPFGAGLVDRAVQERAAARQAFEHAVNLASVPAAEVPRGD